MSYQDSNLDKQSQNLLCYHYTIAQCAPKVSKNCNFGKGYGHYFTVGGV